MKPMGIKNSDYNRAFTITDVPDFGDLEILVNYTGESNCEKAVALDKHVIPHIKNLLGAYYRNETGLKQMYNKTQKRS